MYLIYANYTTQLEKKRRECGAVIVSARTLDRAVRVRTLVGVTLARFFTSVPLSTQEYKWILVFCQIFGLGFARILIGVRHVYRNILWSPHSKYTWNIL